VVQDIASDRRLDPRIKVLLSAASGGAVGDVVSRDELLAEASTPAALEAAAAFVTFMELADSEDIAPSTGLVTFTREFTSSPDGNSIKLQIIRPEGDDVLPCVYYIHGGAMATLSCFYGNYRAWGRIIAAQRVVVVMVDFRNAVSPSSAPEVAPYPAGLHDCLSGLSWVLEHADELAIDTSRVVIAGESGGGNLTLASALSLKRSGELGRIKGLYVLCPYLVGKYPSAKYPSTVENNGIFIELHNNRGVMGYGIEAYEAADPLAWPDFATIEDVTGFPPTVISVNECDPLRDEGVAFYRLLLSAGVAARGRMVLGTMHATEMFPILCPEISRDTARDLAAFATT